MTSANTGGGPGSGLPAGARIALEDRCQVIDDQVGPADARSHRPVEQPADQRVGVLLDSTLR